MTAVDVRVEATRDSDQELVSAIALGSADALGRLYDRHASLVFGLALRILSRREDAEEVVQDVFAQVWRTAARYTSGRASVAGWLAVQARSRAIDRLRSRRARPDALPAVDLAALPDPVSPAEDPEAAALTEADAGRVRGALATLPDGQRQLVELAFFDGLTHSELAARTGAPLGTVKTRLRSAMQVLRAALGGGADPAGVERP